MIGMRKKDVKFYRVDNFKNYPAFLVPSDYLLQHLLQQVQLQQLYSNFELFLHSTLLEEQHLSRTLEQIVAALHPDRDLPPTFYVCELADPDQLSPEDQEYYGQIQQLMNLESESVREQWRGANGHVLFEGRDNSLMASSVDKSAKLHKMKSTEDLIAKIGEGEVPAAEKKAKKKMEVENIAQVIKELKQAHSKEKAESRGAKTDLKYSNFDINFVTTLEQTYLSYMLRSGLKLHYVDYPAWNFAVIEKQLTQTDRVGIIGDYGTGLPDSYELLENMVVNQGVTVILHLGDVYYAGTPEEYETNVMQFLRKLRMKVKRQLLFYSIPGNHDYYSWGLPFLCFVREANSEEFAKQQASYFCLRSEDNRWQFLGADTAYHDANPLDQINQTNLGPRLRKTELAWHKHKMESFPGSTIFLSHHQLFSIHDRLCGSLSQYRNFSCMNPLLSQQLFEYMPYFSAWYWGH